VSTRRLSLLCGGAALVAVVLSGSGCGRAVEGVPTAGAAAPTPENAEDLGELVVPEVPSGLPRLPDGYLHPPAGAKRVEDVAGYATDPGREGEVLEDYGYRFGWERFWGHGTGPVTGVFVDQFEDRAGVGRYVEDLARNEAEAHGGVLGENPPQLPGGCWLLTVEDPPPGGELAGPAAMVWCGHGAFSVSVRAVAGSVDSAEEEARLVLEEQLDRLPPG
jgi:hypothetical protein